MHRQIEQLGLAVHNFHDTYNLFPAGSHQKAFENPARMDRLPHERHDQGRGRWSYANVLLPFLEQQAMYEQLLETPVGIERPWHNTPLMRTQTAMFLCPSDLGSVNVHRSDLAPISYQVNRGDHWVSWDWWECRGVFGRGARTVHSMATILDGTSNTMAISEVKIGRQGSRWVTEAVAIRVGGAGNSAPPSLCLAEVGPNQEFYGDVETGGWQTGWRWADARIPYTMWYPRLPPNGPSCGNRSENWAIITASSYHLGGMNVLMVDGSIRFVSDSIDAGDPTRSVPDLPNPPRNPQDYFGPSLYGLWGALGSSGGKETVQVP